jgi:hypothetical protein
MPTADDRYRAEPDDHQCTEPLEDEDGRTYRICQEPVGAERLIGGGEFPDPSTPARPPAPGSAPDASAPDGDGDTDHSGAGQAADEDQLELPWPS